MKIIFGMKKLGPKKPDAEDEDGMGSEDSGKPQKGDGEEEQEDFGDSGAQMATRAFVKALGIDPDDVDVKKATRALKALVASCKSKGEEY